MTIGTGCAAYTPHEVKLPDKTTTTAIGTDDELYLRLLRLRRSNKHKALHAALSHELDERKDDDAEGCVHAAGDLATLSLEQGWLESAKMALAALSTCHQRLVHGKVADTFISETYVKLWGNSGEGAENTPSIRCNTGHCNVKVLSDYFSWSRPLEDFKVAGSEGKRKGLAVMGAIIGTPFLVGPLNGYRNTRGAFRGTLRYERPRDPEKHMRDLFASLTAAAQKLPFTPDAETFHEQAADVFASIGNDAKSTLRYRLQTALAYSNITGVTRLIAQHASSPAKIEALDYFTLVAQAPPTLSRASATHVVEPYYFDEVSGELSEAAADRYLARFSAGERSDDVRAIQQSLVDFRTKVSGNPRALLSYWRQHQGEPLGKLAIEPLGALVKESVKVLETQIYVANGDGDWVNDAVEHMRPEGVYGGERFNVFVLGAYVNNSNVELPVRLTCNYHLALTITVRALIVSSTETEPVNKSSAFLAYLPPKKPKVFVCLLKNQRSGGGITAGLLGSIDGSISFRDPPVSMDASFEERDISVRELRAQDDLLTAVSTRGNIETKVSPWEAERLAEVGSSGVMLHLHFSGLPRGTVPFTVTNEASQRVYGDTVVLNISDFRTALAPGVYTVTLPKHGISCDVRAEAANTHVKLNVKAGKCSTIGSPSHQVLTSAAAPSTATGTGLPETLTVADIKEGARSAQEAAKRRCKALAQGAESVSIKLSISGASGTVVSAGPDPDTQNTRLTDCVVRELKAATFKRVQKAQTGVLLKVTF